MAHHPETSSGADHHELLQSAGIRGKVLDVIGLVGRGGVQILEVTIAVGVSIFLLTCTVGCSDRTVNADTPPVPNATSQAASENGGVTLVSVTKVSEADHDKRINLHDPHHQELLKKKLVEAKHKAMKEWQNFSPKGKEPDPEAAKHRRALVLRYNFMLTHLNQEIALALTDPAKLTPEERYESTAVLEEFEAMVATGLADEAEARADAATRRNQEATERLYTLAGLKAPAESTK